MPGKTKQELLRFAKERIDEIDRSKMPQEEKRSQLGTYYRVIKVLDKGEAEKLLARYSFLNNFTAE